MFDIRGIDHLNLNVKNLELSKDFYKKLFDLDEKESGTSSLGNKYSIIGKKDGFYLCLYESLGAGEVASGFFNHFGVNVLNYDGIIEKLDHEAIPYEYGGHVEYPGSRSVYVVDPNGIEIEISEKFGGNLDN
ncbi:MAG: VOC family protein [Deltaproteobacteria bacterium]|jgi:lactoylglutathione lyase|nr:MAG: VOC family protein [Deltaproteobacteria bacterium]TNF25984.1 MAG: VOC family protein [Deltaproteobacteria bacterium]